MRPDIDCDVVGFDSATWVRPVSGNDLGQFVRNRMNEPYLLEKPFKPDMPVNRRKRGRKKERERRKTEREKRQERKRMQKPERTKEKEREGKQTADAHFFCLDGISMLLSPQPLVHEAGERDHVGPFVSRFPISVCTPADHDEVGLRSSSTKDGTLCPVLG